MLQNMPLKLLLLLLLPFLLLPVNFDTGWSLTAVTLLLCSRWLHNPGLHIIQVYMDHIGWALWFVGGSSLVRTLPLPLSVQTTLPARQCFQLLGSPGGCTRWTSPCGCREPLQRMRAPGAESSSSPKPARTPLPRLRPREARCDEERCGGKKKAASARQPAAKKARPQPKLHPWTSMVSLDQVVIRPRRTGEHEGRHDAKAAAIDDEEDSSTEDVRVCTTPVVTTDAPIPATGARRDGRAKIRFKPRPVPPNMEAKTRGRSPGNPSGGLTATGAKAKQKARQHKIRGSLRECLRIGTRTKATSEARLSHGKQRAPRSAGRSKECASAHYALIPPASKQAPTHARLDMEAVAVLEPTDWTVVTEQNLPTTIGETPAATTDDMQSTRSQETKEALLRWQREQFVQRAELARMQAAMRDVSHPNAESCDTSAYMGLPALPHILQCIRLPLLQALSSLFAYVEVAFWTAHESAHVCWTIAVHSQLMLAFRSRGWCWLLSTQPLPYSACHRLTLMHGVCHIVPYRLRLCTYMLSRRILIVMRLCVGILLVWWRALFGTCLCGLRCRRWTIQTRWFGQSPHQHRDTKQQIPICRCDTKHPHPHVTSSCPGLNPRGDRTRPTRLHWQLLYMLLLQSCISPVTGVRVGSEPTALPGAQNGRLDNEVTFCAKPSGNLNFSGPYLGAVRKRAYKRACDRAAIRGGTYYRGTWHTARALQAMRVQPWNAAQGAITTRTSARAQPASRACAVVECRRPEPCYVR